MKKIALIFLTSFMFLSCEMWNADIIAFLDKYTNTAAIEKVDFGENPIDLNGIEHLSCAGDKVIRFIMRNPQSYNLTVNISWDSFVLPDGIEAPVLGVKGDLAVEGTLEQISSDKSIIELTIYESYLQEVDNAGGGSPIYSDSLDQVYTHKAGSTIYFDSGYDEYADEISRSVAFVDSKGLVSSTVSVSTNAQPLRDFYVASGSNGNGKVGNPFNNVQSAVEAIKAINDGVSTYTIHVKGSIKEQGSANDKGMVVIESEEVLNIMIQNWTGSEATIDASAIFNSENGVVSAKGLGKRVLYISGVQTKVILSNIIITGGYNEGAQGNQDDPGLIPESSDGKDGEDGGDGFGGGVYILNGSLQMKDSSVIRFNTARGGNGGAGGSGYIATFKGRGGHGGVSIGGGVYNKDGDFTIRAYISDNTAVGGTAGEDGEHGRDPSLPLAKDGANSHDDVYPD